MDNNNQQNQFNEESDAQEQMNQEQANHESQNNNREAETAPPQAENGKWVPVDPETLGFSISGEADKPIQGPDGQIYCIGNSAPTLGSINGNTNNAIPRPSAIIQMPSIVQPISLVPYTSQNQPMLQYDPYSRPLPPQTQADAPRYKKKPYIGISAVLLILSLISLASLLIFESISGGVIKSTGIDLIKALLIIANVGTFTSNFYDNGILSLGSITEALSNDPSTTLFTLALPVLVCLILFITFCLMIKYLARITSAKSPRGFSVWTLINLLLSCSVIAILFGLSSDLDVNTNAASFLARNTIITYGIGIVISAIISIFMLILPFGAKKHAHVLHNPEAKRTYFIEE